MIQTIKKSKEAYSLLENYNGKNPYISWLKNLVFAKKNKVLSDMDVEYIIKNHNKDPETINKIVKISKWFGESCQKKWETDFVPEKILITTLLGETKNTIHAYLRYRQSQDKALLMFIPKRALLDDIKLTDYKTYPVDFSNYENILAKKNKKIYDHQKDDVKFLLARKKAIIANQPGLGKTMSVILASLLGGFKKVLVISPASLKSNWKRELMTFVDESEIGIVNADKWIDDKKYTIINYDIIDRYHKVPTEVVIEKEEVDGKIVEIQKTIKTRKKDIVEKFRKESNIFTSKFDLIIIDEAHKLSVNTSNRYKTILDFLKASNVENIYLMTGTPITNKPYNFLNILTLIQSELAEDWEYYVKTYCDGKQITPKKTGKPIWITSGSSNLDELREKVKGYYIRKTKEDITGMVSRNVVERYYDLTNSEREEYNNVWDEYEEMQLRMGNDELNKDLIEGGLLRIKISEFMISRTIELVNEILDDDEKVFIGCVYNNEIDAFKEYYGDKAVVYKGGMTTKQKDKAEHMFMNDKNTKVFIGNIIAAGVGLNLTAASKMVINSIPYVPGDLEQLIDRIHRLTQTRDVYAYIQLFNNTISERVWDTILRKQFVIDSVIKKESEKK